MRSFNRSLCLALLLVSASARAQAPAQGFAVERFYPSAPTAGWFVMDDLDIHGGIGGALSLTLGYAANPLRVTDGTHRLAVVSDEAFADVGAAITWRRFRFYVNIDSPLVITGQSGTVGDFSFQAPSSDPTPSIGSAQSVNPSADPDLVFDSRVGADVRIWGAPGGPFRVGAGAQLIIPFGNRSEYDTDGTFRGMVRALAAGDWRWLTWAAQLGVHIRPLDDAPAPGSPRGSELLFGAAMGAKLPVDHAGRWRAVVGPEVYGATAFSSFLSTEATALEGLLSGRVEGTRSNAVQLRARLGVGTALNHRFGAAEWRVVVGVELFGARERH